jgi:signal transduction histidine kinase
MKRITPWSYEWVYTLTVSLLFLAATLRTLLIYSQMPDVLNRDLALLAVWLALFLGEPAITRRWRRLFNIYLAILAALVALMLLSPDPGDYFAILFAPLSMRALQQLGPRPGVYWVAAFSALILIPLVHTVGPINALAFGLIYSAADALFAFSSLAIRRAGEAHARNQAMQEELQQSNLQLQAYAGRLKQLAVARERNRLARDLHDSVTQTVFSMTLTTQSALLLLDRDTTQVKAQLNHLAELTGSAMAEMQTLISQLAKPKMEKAGLAAQIRQHLDERAMPEGLSLSIDAESDGPLAANEQQALFRIIQEALNNISKHTQASQACIRLHLSDPQWIEIEDNGQGFNVEKVKERGGIGLSSMRERAGEIGWDLQVHTAPGAGTRIRVEKDVSDERS